MCFYNRIISQLKSVGFQQLLSAATLLKIEQASQLKETAATIFYHRGSGRIELANA
ncbi:hypothetical protein [Lyngbya aestuarii]|uniref:hypothetical protein n=1 Tax=Lyngbya aestuarii TaxID=118322 RepID=UPI00403E0786